MKILDEYDIGSLYTKFCEGGVTPMVLWDLTDEILEDIGLTKLDKLSYLKGKKSYNDQFSKQPGMYSYYLTF